MRLQLRRCCVGGNGRFPPDVQMKVLLDTCNAPGGHNPVLRTGQLSFEQVAGPDENAK